VTHSPTGVAETPLQVLVVDDEDRDALHIVAELCRGGYDAAFERVDTGIGLLEALSRRRWDVVIADQTLLQFSALGVLDILHDREIDVPVRWIGFEIPNKFVIGYGLDFAERYRNLPYVAVLHPDLIPPH
jgi:CheY-like chemotaxis protein